MIIRRQHNIKSATDTAGICAVPEVLGASEDFDLDTWVKTLIARAEPQIRKHFSSITWDYDDTTLWAYAAKNENGTQTLIDIEIPLEDFSWNYTKMDDDVNYLVDGLVEQLSNSDEAEPVESAVAPFADSWGEVDVDRDPKYQPDDGLYDPDEFNCSPTEYTMLRTKSVLDSDGFWTDYSLYETECDGEVQYVCIFGDNELYNPSNTEPDAEFDAIEVAEEWFDNYEGFADDDVDDDDYLNDHW